MASLSVCAPVMSPGRNAHGQPVAEHEWGSDSPCKAASLVKAFRQTKGGHGDAAKRNRAALVPAVGQATQSSKRIKLSETELSPENQTLVSIFDGLLMAQAILMARGIRCTFDKLIEPAEKQSGHQVQVPHLQQIKGVYPEAVEWSWVSSSTRSNMAHPHAMPGKILKVALGPAVQSDDAITSAAIMRRHKPAMQSQAMKASVSALRARLAAVEQGVELELAPLPGVASDDDKFVSSSQESASESVIELSPIPESLSPSGILRQTSSVAAISSGSHDCPVRKATHSRRVRFGNITIHPIPGREALKQKRTTRFASLWKPSQDVKCSSDTETDSSSSSGSDSESDSDSGTDSDVAEVLLNSTEPGNGQTTCTLETLAAAGNNLLNNDLHQDACKPVSTIPAELFTAGSDGELPLSMDTLHALQEMEAEDAGRNSEAEKRACEVAKARCHLTRTFDILQALFGRSGPCVKPQAEVIARVKHTCSVRSPVSTEEVNLMLEVLAAEAPEYLQLQLPKKAGQEAIVRINRRLQLNSLRKDLQKKALEQTSCA